MKKATKKEPKPISCDWKTPESKRAKTRSQQPVGNKDRIIKYRGNFRWNKVKTEKYKQKSGRWASIIRKVLIGNSGETAKFHIRYFEIEPDGYSSLERHRHEHVVICIRGRGDILMGGKSFSLNYLDTAYVAPNTVHQLTNPHNEPFGFFCIVNAKRDKPKLVHSS